jgi:hypothetical protein
MINKKTQLIQQKKTKTLPKKIIPKDKNLLHNKFLIIIKKILNICGNKKRKKNIIKGGVYESLKSQINNFINDEMKKSMEYFIGLEDMKMKSIKYNNKDVINNLDTTRKNLLNLITIGNPNLNLNQQNYSNFEITKTKKIDLGLNNYQFFESNFTVTFSSTIINYLIFSNEPTFDSKNTYFMINNKTEEALNKARLLDYYIFIDYLLFNIKKKKIDLNNQSYNFDYLPEPLVPPETEINKMQQWMYYGMEFYNNEYNINDYIYDMYMYEDQINKRKIIINKIKLNEDELDLKNLIYFDINFLKLYGKNMNNLNSDKKYNILKHAAIINIGITLNHIKDIKDIVQK